MYMDDTPITPENRISDEMLRRMLDDSPLDRKSPSPDLPQKTNLHLPDGFPLASVYAPTQVFRNLYDIDEALMRGTVFKELDLPFMGLSIMKGGNCRG